MVKKTTGIIAIIAGALSSVFVLILLVAFIVIILVGRYTKWGRKMVNKLPSWLSRIILFKDPENTTST